MRGDRICLVTALQNYITDRTEGRRQESVTGNTVRWRCLSAGRIKILNAYEDVGAGWRAYTNTRLVNGTRFHNKDEKGKLEKGYR